MLDLLIGAAVEVAAQPADSNSDRAWAANRPNRGAHARVVGAAAQPPRGWASWAACVSNRESHGNPRAVNSGSGAAGKWQFMPAWRHGLPYMVRDRLVANGLPKKQARKVRIYLSGLHYIQKWPEIYQDIGMAEVVARGGAFHWNGHTCGNH